MSEKTCRAFDRATQQRCGRRTLERARGFIGLCQMHYWASVDENE